MGSAAAWRTWEAPVSVPVSIPVSVPAPAAAWLTGGVISVSCAGSVFHARAIGVRNPAALPSARRGTGGTDGIRPGRTEGAGLGLLGLTERAVLAGGELTYGRDRAGDFVVTARLPWSR